MSFFPVFIKVARSLYSALKALLAGSPVAMPSLGSATLGKDDVKLARESLTSRSGWADGAVVDKYEKMFADWNGSSHAFAFMGGRVALSACVHALGLRPGDEVILPGYTCVVVPNAFMYAGVKTVYCDIELETYGLDASKIEEKITGRTRAVVLQHLYGIVCRDYEKIISIARRRGIVVIEDCAHATGALFKGRKVGNYGDAAIYSSENSKVYSTVMGGIATTNNDNIAAGLKDYYDRAPLPDDGFIDRLLHNVILNYYTYAHPLRWLLRDAVNIMYGDKRLISTTDEEERGIKPVGYGCRMAAPVAAIGINQLNKIDYYNDKRRETARRWKKWVVEKGYAEPLVIEGSTPVYLRYPVLVEPELKKDLKWAVNDLGLVPGVWFETHIHPTSRPVHGCPNADRAVAGCVNFPTLMI